MSELDYAGRIVKCCLLQATWLLYSQTHNSHDCLNKIKGAFFFADIRYMIQVSLLVEDLWIVHNCCGKREMFLLENVDNGRFLILHLVAPHRHIWATLIRFIGLYKINT